MKTGIIFFAASLLMVSTAQSAETAGTVGYMSGTLVAQRADGTVKVLARKSGILPGDMLITAKDSYAQVKMNDGTQMTLRPDSNLRIEAFQFNSDKPAADNMALRLLKGGFRTVTGMIGKRGNADAYKLRAASATIGIRGTDFTTRLCVTQACKDSDEAAAQPVAEPQAPAQRTVGRVMLVEGELSARGADGKPRKLMLGGMVYEGEVLVTGGKSHAVVAFRDEGRITLQERTEFHVEKFRYDKAAGQEGAALRLVKGSVRVVTGWVGRIKRDNYQFRVANATIGIRGTGFDAWCRGPCASGAANPGATERAPLDGAGVYVWAGEVALVTPAGFSIVAIQQAAIIARDTGKPVRITVIPPAITDNPAPRPDSVPVKVDELFGPEAGGAGDAGVYVTVHDGHVVLSQDGARLDLGTGQTGFANEQVLTRLAAPPAFLNSDPKMDPTGSGLRDSGGVPEGGCRL
ncbi:MAG TPA: FecR domain-containing protein [Gallionella sp.]